MPPTSRCRQSRRLRVSYPCRTRHPHAPHRGMRVVGWTSQTTPSSSNETPTTRVDLMRSSLLSRVVARTGSRSPVGVFGDCLGTPDPVRVPPAPLPSRPSRPYAPISAHSLRGRDAAHPPNPLESQTFVALHEVGWACGSAG